MPAIDTLGPVADQFHRDGSGDSGPLEVPHGRPAEIVGDHAEESCALAGAPPAPPETPDRLPTPVEYVGDDRPSFALQPSRVLALLRQENRELGQGADRKLAAFAIFRRAGL